MVGAKRHFLTKFKFFGPTRFQHFLFLDPKNQNALKKCWRSSPTFFSWRFVAFFLFVSPKPETFASLGVLPPVSQFLMKQQCGARDMCIDAAWAIDAHVTTCRQSITINHKQHWNRNWCTDLNVAFGTISRFLHHVMIHMWQASSCGTCTLGLTQLCNARDCSRSLRSD